MSRAGASRSARFDHRHQTAHPFLAAGAERRHDFLVAEAGVDRLVRRDQFAGIDPEARQRPARPRGPQGVSKVACRPSASIATSAPRPSVRRLISATRSCARIERDVRAEPARHGEAWRSPSTPMISDAPRSFAPTVAHSPIGPCANTATAVADTDVAGFGSAQPGRGDVRQQQDLLVRRVHLESGEIRPRVRNQQVFCPGTVDGVAEPPAAQRATALRMHAVQAIEALTTGRNRTDNHPLPHGVLVVETLAQLLDDADRLVPEDQARPDRYSPLTMCTSVPQMVVVVIRMTASPAPAEGVGTSSMPIVVLFLGIPRRSWCA